MFDVIYDPQKETGALIDPDNGRALGPLIAGPEQVVAQLFDTFVGALNADPATIHPADLDHHFRGFVDALAEEEIAHPTPADGAPSAPSTEQQPATAGDTGSASPAEPPAPAETAQPGETGGVAGPVGGTEQAPVAAEGSPISPTAATDALAPGQVADGGLPSGGEQAPVGTEGTPGADATPTGTSGGGIPKAPGA